MFQSCCASRDVAGMSMVDEPLGFSEKVRLGRWLFDRVSWRWSPGPGPLDWFRTSGFLLPSGKLTYLLKDPPFSMGKLTINGHFQ